MCVGASKTQGSKWLGAFQSACSRLYHPWATKGGSLPWVVHVFIIGKTERTLREYCKISEWPQDEKYFLTSRMHFCSSPWFFCNLLRHDIRDARSSPSWIRLSRAHPVTHRSDILDPIILILHSNHWPPVTLVTLHIRFTLIWLPWAPLLTSMNLGRSRADQLISTKIKATQSRPPFQIYSYLTIVTF